MNDPLPLTFLTTATQAVGMMLVAGIMLPMARVIPGLFLRYWSVGWLCLAIALFLLFGSVALPWGEPYFVASHCVFEYLFGFMLWAGCRELTTGRAIRPVHFAILALPIAFGLAAPFVLPARPGSHGFSALLPYHAIIVAALFLCALLATRSYQSRLSSQGVGIWLLRGALLGLTLLFFQHTAATLYLTYFDPTARFGYLAYSPLYEVLLETILALGMVVVATDRLRDQLEEKNRQLESAAAELAHAARTDALTGLLNRRAFEELPRHGASIGVASGSLAVLDLNNLKLLNDRHGHPAGDVALQLVARTLRSQFRVTDPIYRTGGDEFVVVTAGLAEADLTARLTQVDLALHGLRLPGVAEPTDIVIAWGVAAFHTTSELGEAYHKADESMYLCKKRRKAVPVTPVPAV